MSGFEKVRKAKKQYQEVILRMPNVVGIGTGYKIVGNAKTEELCIVTLVREKIPAAKLPSSGRVPPRINDVLTDVIEVGELRAQQAQANARMRWRPAPPGVSLGHYDITAGTFGAVVWDRNDHSLLILSNNHVLANCNRGATGDAILQPGTADGGTNPNDRLAELTRFIPVRYTDEQPSVPPMSCQTQLLIALARFLGLNRLAVSLQKPPEIVTNLVDAAVAKPLNESDILEEILEIGKIDGIAAAELGSTVRKFGRTSGLTTGTIIVVDTTVTVGYDGNHMARFDNQVLTTAMSQGGDSGSLIVDGGSQKAVGLLFAGSDKSTVFTPIQTVLDKLEVTL